MTPGSRVTVPADTKGTAHGGASGVVTGIHPTWPDRAMVRFDGDARDTPFPLAWLVEECPDTERAPEPSVTERIKAALRKAHDSTPPEVIGTEATLRALGYPVDELLASGHAVRIPVPPDSEPAPGYCPDDGAGAGIE